MIFIFFTTPLVLRITKFKTTCSETILNYATMQWLFVRLILIFEMQETVRKNYLHAETILQIVTL